jgi:hypothetical protein
MGQAPAPAQAPSPSLVARFRHLLAPSPKAHRRSVAGVWPCRCHCVGGWKDASERAPVRRHRPACLKAHRRAVAGVRIVGCRGKRRCGKGRGRGAVRRRIGLSASALESGRVSDRARRQVRRRIEPSTSASVIAHRRPVAGAHRRPVAGAHRRRCHGERRCGKGRGRGPVRRQHVARPVRRQSVAGRHRFKPHRRSVAGVGGRRCHGKRRCVKGRRRGAVRECEGGFQLPSVSLDRPLAGPSPSPSPHRRPLAMHWRSPVSLRGAGRQRPLAGARKERKGVGWGLSAEILHCIRRTVTDKIGDINL